MRCEIIALIFACAVCHHCVSTSAKSNEKEYDVQEIFMKLYSKFDDLIDKVDELAAGSSTGNDAIQKLVQQNQIFDYRLKKMEDRLLETKKYEDVPIKLQRNANACEPNPCNGGRCKVTGSDYTCTYCPTDTYGIYCEKVKCDPSDQCFRRNDTIYFVFETNLGWEEANRRCAKEGMTLAEPKDKSTNQFIVSQLKSIYSKGSVRRDVVFWIGLKYNESKRQWQWTDGSALGNYTGEWAYFKIFTKGYCGYLYLYGGSRFWWNYDCLALSTEYTVYPLCEKHIV